jgi:DNA-binding CsgD family transcriptional regulator/tetratricopeptide (TPR) repeat protein
VFVGRHAERSRVGEVLADARRGRGRALVVSGPPGVGKSDLLARIAADAEGWLVLSARGVPAEKDLPFSGLHQLLAPALGELDAIPAVQARALRGALGLGEPEPGHRLEVLAGTLSLLVAVAREQPVVLVIDDAHQLDADSADALGFVARRLHVGGMALIAAKRSGQPSAFDDGSCEELRLGGLELDEARELLADKAVAEDVVERLWRDTGGNPLALTSLPERLAAGERSGREPIVGPTPAATQVRRIYESRIFALPPETRRALLVVAASDESSMATINDAVAAIGADPERLAAAEQAGIVTIRDGAVEFRDPLLRSAMYHDAAPADRRAAHDALAGALSEERDADRRAWHRASAVSAPDEDVALGLEEAALRARRRGGVAVEAMALARAARLTPDGERRAARLLAAARSTAHAGRLGPAAGLLEEALALAASSEISADIELERGRLLAAAGCEHAAGEVLRRAADDVVPHDPQRATRLLAEDALLMLGEHELAAAAASCERATGLGTPDESPAGLALEIALAATRLATGSGDDAVATLQAACQLGEAIADPTLVAWLSHALSAAGEGESVRPLLARMLEQHRVAGDLWSLQQELVALADLELRGGQMISALEAAREALQLAEELGSVRALRRSLLALALVEGLLGREIDCREHVQLALDSHSEGGAFAPGAVGGLAIGLLELSLGRPAEAIVALESVRRYARHVGLDDPGWLPWEAVLVESYVAEARPDEAREIFDAFETRARSLGRGPLQAAVARSAGLLADDDAFSAHFDQALELLERDANPFELARTRLCYGERLVRVELHEPARELLRAALDGFELLRATPWAERTRSALASCGEIARRQTPRAVDLLTPQELQVVRLVAEGARNRDVAARLFLSQKTVEYHLRNTFRKLDVRSRTELVTRLAAEGSLSGGGTI